MKKTQFRIGLLTACLIGANTAFCSIASAQSCGAESCDSKSCKCSKKHCDDAGLLEVINSAASNFEAGLASMIPDGQKRKAKPSCDCSKCSAAVSEHSHVVPMAPPTIHEKEHVHSHAPHTAAPINPIHSPIPTPIPTPAPAPVPDAHSNPFRDDTTRNQRTLPSRPASLLRQKNSGSPIEYDPQARTLPTMRSNSLSLATTKSVSDLPDGLATTKSTRRALSAPEGHASSNQLAANQAAANQLRGNLQSDNESSFERNVERSAMDVQSLDRVAPEVVPASSTIPLRKLQELQSPIEATNANRLPAAATSEMYVNPLRAQ